jgi:hypothetical protein
MFVTSSHGKKMEEQEQRAREEEERTMRCKVEEEGCKIKEEGGAGWQWGTSCSASLEGTCSWRGAVVIVILVVVAMAMAMARAAARTRSSRIAKVQQKGTRGDKDDAKEREDDSCTRHAGI